MKAKNQKLILRFSNYLEIIEGYLNIDEFKTKAPSTVHGKEIVVISLCNYLGNHEILNFKNCLQKHVLNFLSSITTNATSTISAKTFILRHFFNYLHSQGITSYSGNELFPVIFTNKRERILSFYSKDEINKVISCINNTTYQGKRDLVIVLMAAELGMRSGDICRLKLSNIHWEHDTIEFSQQKTGIFNRLPLLDNLKFAIIDYLKNVRPGCESDLLFVGKRNNYGIISNSQMHNFVSRYFKKAGIDISKRKHGPHALRHSLASNMLQNNTPMYVIKDVLGHTNLNTTKIYLNIDFETLRQFALEVPDEKRN